MPRWAGWLNRAAVRPPRVVSAHAEPDGSPPRWRQSGRPAPRPGVEAGVARCLPGPVPPRLLSGNVKIAPTIRGCLGRWVESRHLGGRPPGTAHGERESGVAGPGSNLLRESQRPGAGSNVNGGRRTKATRPFQRGVTTGAVLPVVRRQLRSLGKWLEPTSGYAHVDHPPPVAAGLDPAERCGSPAHVRPRCGVRPRPWRPRSMPVERKSSLRGSSSPAS
jgi:hypothetical protein